jgi:hypothetical protein
MLKQVVALLCLACVVLAQNCPPYSTNNINGYQTRYCYRYLGTTKSYTKAVDSCRQYGYTLVMPKTDAGLDDLYKLYKAYSNFYFWVGASASPSNPFQFYFQDGNPLFPIHYCAGNPKGKDNLCGFYTTTAVVGRDRCISTGPCQAAYFDHGIICQTT